MNLETNQNYSLGPGQSGGGWQHGQGQSSPSPDVNMMMQQIQQLQKTVLELQASSGQGPAGSTGTGNGGNNGVGRGFNSGAGGFYGAGGDFSGGYSSYRESTPGTHGYSTFRTSGIRTKRSSNEEEENIDEEQKVLLVSNIPPNLANPDSIFYAFEKFGAVDRVKILHNKRNTALVQMSQPIEAQKAINEQEKLNRVGTEIYVNYSSKFKEITIPEPGSIYDDGLTKDFTGQFPSQQPRQNNFNMGPRFDSMGDPPMGGSMGMFGGMDMGRNGGSNINMGQHYGMMGSGMNNFGEMGRVNPGSGVVLLVSNIPEEIAKVDTIFNMIGMYGDVVAVKILRNKRDCCLVQLAKPHQAQQVRHFLDQAKVGGKKLCISNSRVENLLNKRIAEDDEQLQMTFENSRNHRYRNHQMAAKLTRNLGPPSSTLHVANLPEELTHNDVKDMFIERGFTVKESKECGANGTMALLTMASPDEALMALAVMHNYAPEDYKFKNASGLCVSFSAKK